MGLRVWRVVPGLGWGAGVGGVVAVAVVLPAVLAGTDPEIVQVVARKLKKLGVEVMTGAKAKSWGEKGGRAASSVDVGGKRRRSTPTRCWWRWAAAPTPRTWGSRRWA